MTSPVTDAPARLYLDHASTSWPKAVGVVEAMTAFMVEVGASSSRGNYHAAQQAQQIVDRVRRQLADAIAASDPVCVTFHSGCTAALNAAIHGMIRPGDHAIASAVEHNAVLRPLAYATRHAGTDAGVDRSGWANGSGLTVVPCDRDGQIDVQRMLDSVVDSTRMIALTHASNVTGTMQPVKELSQALRPINRHRDEERRIWLMCDAAQTFGYVPVDVNELGVDLLAAPAHKGWGGPPGTAMLYLNPELHSIIRPTIQGGSGHDGMSDRMPEAMPGRLEAGTINVPAIAGWGAALDARLDAGEAADETDRSTNSRLTGLSVRLREQLDRIPGIRVVGRRGELPIASIDFGPMLPASDAAAILDHEFSIDVRAGYHCASRIHQHLGTEAAGTLRISCGHSTTMEDVDRAVEAIKEITESLQPIVGV